jgi:Pectate lyase superfamily protein
MPRDGNGNYVLDVSNPVIANTIIKSSEFNSTMNDIAQALSTSVARNGESPMTGNLNLGGNKITNVLGGTTELDIPTIKQIQSGNIENLLNIAGSDTITASCPVSFLTYTNGQKFTFKPTLENTTAATLNINSLGAKPLFYNGEALKAKFLKAGVFYNIIYDDNVFNVEPFSLLINYSSEINLKALGAKGDGIADDTIYLQQAFDLQKINKKAIYVPAGIYLITQQCTYNSCLALYGDSPLSSFLKCTLINGGGVIKAAYSNPLDLCPILEGAYIENLNFTGPGYNVAGDSIGFEGRTYVHPSWYYTDNHATFNALPGWQKRTSHNVNISMNNVHFYQWYRLGIALCDSFNCEFRNIRFIDCGNIAASPGGNTNFGGAMFWDKQFADTSTTGNQFHNCYFANCNKPVLSPYDSNSPSAHQQLLTYFNGCKFESNNIGVYSPRSRYVTFENCYWEGNNIKGAILGSSTFINCSRRYSDSGDRSIRPEDDWDVAGEKIIISGGEIEYSFGNQNALKLNLNETTPRITNAVMDSGALKIGFYGNTRIYWGVTSPENITAAAGSLYLSPSERRDNILYVKTIDGGTTGWLPVLLQDKGTLSNRYGNAQVGDFYYDYDIGNLRTFDGARWNSVAFGNIQFIEFNNAAITGINLEANKTYVNSSIGFNLNSLYFNFPNNGQSGDVINFKTAQNINLITYSNDDAIYNAKTSLIAGQQLQFIYNKVSNLWYCFN